MLTYSEAYEKAITSSEHLKDICEKDGYANVFLVHSFNGLNLTPSVKVSLGRVYLNPSKCEFMFRYVDMERFVESRKNPSAHGGAYRNGKYNGSSLRHWLLGINKKKDDSDYPIDKSLMFLSEKDAAEYSTFLKSPEYEQICIEAALRKSRADFEEELLKEKIKKEIEEEQKKEREREKDEEHRMDIQTEIPHMLIKSRGHRNPDLEESEKSDSEEGGDPVTNILYLLGIAAGFATAIIMAIDVVSK